MNILAVDFGTKNIGLAWINTVIGVVLPFGIIKADDKKNKILELNKLIKEEKIDKVVIGLPLGLDGKEHPATARARAFGEELKQSTEIPVIFFDERFSSQQADRMEGSGASRDEKSAMVILGSYLEKNKLI